MAPKLDAEFARLHRMPDPDLRKVKMARTVMAIAGFLRGRRRARDVSFKDTTVAGERKIKVRVYRPANVERPGVLVYFHGGGFVVGNLDTEHNVCLAHARDGRCVVVSVGYRLAPEFPFPAAHDDGWTVMNWLRANAAALGIDDGRIAVGGGSAGAAIAAGLALRARDEGVLLALVLLQQPVIDHLSRHHSAQTFNDTPFLKAKHIPMAWSAYFGRQAPTGRALGYAAAFAADDLKGLASTLIVAGNCDPARDEAIVYARRLVDAGVEVDLHLFAGAPHGFDLVESAPAARHALALRGAALRRAIGGAAKADRQVDERADAGSRSEDRRVQVEGKDIAVRLYRPTGRAKAGALVYLGDNGDDLGLLAQSAPCVIVSAHGGAANAVEQERAILGWVRAKPHALGADGKRIALGGTDACADAAIVIAQTGANGSLRLLMLTSPELQIADLAPGRLPSTFVEADSANERRSAVFDFVTALLDADVEVQLHLTSSQGRDTMQTGLSGERTTLRAHALKRAFG